MRPPINLRRSARLEIRRMFKMLECKCLREGTPVRKHGFKKIRMGWTLREFGYKVPDQYLMDTILKTLPSSWDTVKGSVLQEHNPSSAIELVMLLEEKERDLHPLWIALETDRMPLNSTVRDHVLGKQDIYNRLSAGGFSLHLSILTYAIVSTLPPSWPIKTIRRVMEKENVGMKDLLVFLEKEERMYDPMWVEFLKKEMISTSSVYCHIICKYDLWQELQKRGYIVDFSIFVEAVVNTLPRSWPHVVSKTICAEHPPDLTTLVKVLEEVEDDIILSAALDEVEQNEDMILLRALDEVEHNMVTKIQATK